MRDEQHEFVDSGRRHGPQGIPLCRICGFAQESICHSNRNEIQEQRDDAVNHPSHYGGDTVYEAIKVIMAWGLGFNLGNAVKYISRAGKKDKAKQIEDLKKARFYLDYEIELLEGKR